MKGKYLITTREWFIAPDGKQYKAAWGEVEILQDDFLGIKTNRNSVNWYAKVGSTHRHVIIAGCQINYAVHCLNPPECNPGEDWSLESGKLLVYETPNKIYLAEEGLDAKRCLSGDLLDVDKNGLGFDEKRLALVNSFRQQYEIETGLPSCEECGDMTPGFFHWITAKIIEGYNNQDHGK